MGLLKHLLFWPVTGPTFLTRFSVEKVHDALRTELTDDAAIREELMELGSKLELGEIDEAEYVEREAAIMRRLREVRAWRDEFGMPVSGGLVRVVDEEQAGAENEAGTEAGAEASPGTPSGVEVSIELDDDRDD